MPTPSTVTRFGGGPLLFAFVAFCHTTSARADEVKDFFPVIAPTGADPWVIRHDGYYYMTVSTNANVTVWRSPTLTGLGGGEKKVIWTPPAKGPKSKNLWAPELHHLNGKWYVYYAADDGDNANHRMYVLENTSADPFRGEFVDKGSIADPKNDRWAIDGTVLTVKAKHYFLWSGWEGDKNVRQDLYIAAMSNPWTLAGPRVEISRPTHKWETVGEPTVNEGPQVLIRGDSIHIVYSASGSWTDDYCLGLLTAKAGSDLLDPKSWVKYDKPVFQSKNGVFGPGHCSFVSSPDGKEDWLVYHAARFSGAGWDRNIRTQKFDWNKDDTPRFGQPVSADELIALPGGEPMRQRYEVEAGTLSGGAKVARRAGASKAAAVGELDTAESSVEVVIEVKEKGTYLLAVRFTNPTTKKKSVASHRLSVNDTDAGEIEYPYTGDDWSTAVLRVELKAGANTIRFGKGKPGGAVDCFDLAIVR